MEIIEVKRMKQKVTQQPNLVLRNPECVAEVARSLFGKVDKETIYFLGLTKNNAVSSAYELEHSSLEDFILDKETVRFMFRELLLANITEVMIVIQSPLIIIEQLTDWLKGLFDTFNQELKMFSITILDIVKVQVSDDGSSVVDIFSFLENDIIELNRKSEIDGMVL